MLLGASRNLAEYNVCADVQYLHTRSRVSQNWQGSVFFLFFFLARGKSGVSADSLYKQTKGRKESRRDTAFGGAYAVSRCGRAGFHLPRQKKKEATCKTTSGTDSSSSPSRVRKRQRRRRRYRIRSLRGSPQLISGHRSRRGPRRRQGLRPLSHPGQAAQTGLVASAYDTRTERKKCTEKKEEEERPGTR